MGDKNFDHYQHEMKELEQMRLILNEIHKITSNKSIVKKRRTDSRRPKLAIYNDILSAIQAETGYGEVKPTRIQFRSRTSYDKLLKYLTDLEKRNLITRNPLKITEKGRHFLDYYDQIKKDLDTIATEFLN